MADFQERQIAVELENSLFTCRGLALSLIQDLIAENERLEKEKSFLRLKVLSARLSEIVGRLNGPTI